MQRTSSRASFQNPLHPLFQGICCRHVQVCYHHHVAIEDLSGTFAPGSLTAIVGPNGGGKSTLLKALKGFIPLTRGTIDMEGASPADIAYLPQCSEIDRSFPLTVFDVVTMGLCPRVGFYRRMTAQDQQQAFQALEKVGLQDYAQASLNTLSGGQFQRLLFARVALQQASIILLDEPFAAIDTHTMELLSTLLQQWRQEGRTILAILHDIDIVREFFPQTLILARRCIAWGETADVLTPEALHQAREASRSWEKAPSLPQGELSNVCI